MIKQPNPDVIGPAMDASGEVWANPNVVEVKTAEDLISECSIYLKDGETPKERMNRDQSDVLGLMNLLRIEKEKVEKLLYARAQLAQAVEFLMPLKNADESDFNHLDYLLKKSVRHSEDMETKFWLVVSERLRDAAKFIKEIGNDHQSA